MRSLILILSGFLMTVMFLSGCNNTKSTNQTVKVETADISKVVEPDSVEILTLVRNMYKWYETKSTKGEFFGQLRNPKDTVYSGIDWKANANRIKEFVSTNFFANEFLDNYQRIARYIDSELRQKQVQWIVGDMSPFDSDVNEWCNCQDYPDNYWSKITITDLVIVRETASFRWTWGDKIYYSVRAKKEQGAWKIAWLEGFDFTKYSDMNYACRGLKDNPLYIVI
jgi:hypothetical protein